MPNRLKSFLPTCINSLTDESFLGISGSRGNCIDGRDIYTDPSSFLINLTNYSVSMPYFFALLYYFMVLKILSSYPPPPKVSYLFIRPLSWSVWSVGLARMPISCISFDFDLYLILWPAGF